MGSTIWSARHPYHLIILLFSHCPAAGLFYFYCRLVDRRLPLHRWRVLLPLLNPSGSRSLLTCPRGRFKSEFRSFHTFDCISLHGKKKLKFTQVTPPASVS